MSPRGTGAAAGSRVAIDKPVLFVVGSGRSGTTLLYELLCSHSRASWFSNHSQRLAALSWLHPAVPHASKADRGARWSPRPVEGYLLYDRIRPVDPASDRPLLAADLTAVERERLRRAVATHLRPRRRAFFVNKNTRNTRRVGYLAEAFPEAVWVHIVRHPVAVAASMAKVAFFPGLSLYWRGGRTVRELVASGECPEVLAAELWAEETSSCRAALKGVAPDRQLELRYESLVEHPLELLEDALRLAGQSLTESTRSMAGATRTPNRNQAAFSAMAPDVRARVWEVAGAVADRYGYGPV